MWFLEKKKVDAIRVNIPREDLIRRSRILVVDNEEPELIEDMKSACFSVDYAPDITKTNISIIEQTRYDLIILDFGDIGVEFGDNEGLSLLRYIKRVNPAIVVLAYTSKFLGTENSDFYRLSDMVLSKDSGIQDSLEKVESALKIAHSPKHIWNAILKVSGIENGTEEDFRNQDLLVRGLKSKSKLEKFKEKVGGINVPEVGKKMTSILIEKIFETYLLYKFGTK